MNYLNPGDKVFFVVTCELVVPATVVETDDVYAGMSTTVWHTRNKSGTVSLSRQDPDSEGFNFISVDESKLKDLDLVNQFLNIDEPVGHHLSLGDDVFLTLNDALSCVYPSSKRKKHRRFRNWRNSSIRWIIETHRRAGVRQAWLPEYRLDFPKYPSKRIITKSN